MRALIVLTLLLSCSTGFAQTKSTIIIGDSIIWGTGISDPLDTVPSLISAAGYRTHNLTSPGNNLWMYTNQTSGAINLVDGIFGGVENAVIQVGFNDWNIGRPVAEFWNNYDVLLDNLQSKNVNIFCTILFPVGQDIYAPNAAGAAPINYALAVLWQCQAHGGTFLSIVLDASDYPPNDSVHPNESGHLKMANAIIQALP